jgi:cytochrome P450
MTLADIDTITDIPPDIAGTLVDATAYADGRIHETYSWLRANNPVGRAKVDGFDPFWVITRFEDLREISRDNTRFPYGDRPVVVTDQASEAFTRKMTGGKLAAFRSLVQMDPPDHMKYRLLTQAWFMPKNLRTLDARISEIADETVAKLRGLGGACDFVSDIALRYPLEVVMEILGVPAADYDLMLKLTQQNFAPSDPDSIPDGLDVNDPTFRAQAGRAFATSLAAYFAAISDDRRRNPRDDIATIIANAKVDGQPIPPEDELGYYAIIATAGHDTTSSSTARAMWALARDPQLFARVKADPALVPLLIEEAIRWETPVKTFMRSVADDCEFAGRPFKAGDWLMLCYASANRDEAVIQDGSAFRIDRGKSEHMAFGFGPHVCLGQHLARQEMKALFERLLPAIRSVTLDGETEMSQSYFVNGLKRLPIRFELEVG